MPVRMVHDPNLHTCDSCNYQAAGYRKGELQRNGWIWHSLKENRWFILCNDCTDRHKQRRKAA